MLPLKVGQKKIICRDSNIIESQKKEDDFLTTSLGHRVRTWEPAGKDAKAQLSPLSKKAKLDRARVRISDFYDDLFRRVFITLSDTVRWGDLTRLNSWLEMVVKGGRGDVVLGHFHFCRSKKSGKNPTTC